MNRRTFTLRAELVGPEVRRFLDALAQFATTALLIIRIDLDISESCRAALLRLSPFLVRKAMRNAWPGTQLIGDEAELREYRYDAACRAAILELSPSLFAWKQPDLPEDLCLLRSDSSTVLGTTAHERDAFVELSDEELRGLLEAMPELAGRLA